MTGRVQILEISDQEMLASFERPNMLSSERSSEALRGMLGRMSPPLAKQFIVLINSPSRGRGFACPTEWRVATLEMHADTMLQTSQVVASATIPPRDLGDLVTPAAIEALTAMLMGRWSAMTLRRHLTSLRAMVRALYGHCPVMVRTSIIELGKAPPKNVWDLVRSPEENIEAALVLAAKARELAQRGKTRRARTRMRDAAILGVVALLCFRRGETKWLDVRNVVVDADEQGLTLYLEAAHSKVNLGAVRKVGNADVADLLLDVLGSRRSGPLFVTNNGVRLGAAELYRVLVRTSMAHHGAPTSFNVLRKSGASSKRTIRDMRALLKHSPSSTMAERVYRKRTVAASLTTVRNAFSSFGPTRGG